MTQIFDDEIKFIQLYIQLNLKVIYCFLFQQERRTDSLKVFALQMQRY